MYKSYRNILTDLVRIAKKKHHNNKLNEAKNNMKKTLHVINEILNRKQNKSELPQRFQYNNKDITKPQQITDRFNDFFVNLGPNLAKKYNHKSRDFEKYLQGDYLN